MSEVSAAKDVVRVGIIRCDTHAFFYAHIFDRPNPALSRKHHWGNHYYFHHWDDPARKRIPTVPGMAITRLLPDRPWEQRDTTGANARGLAQALDGRPKICKSLDEVSDDVDLVYIADCDHEGKDHLKFAAPGLKKGVPHFVDKPFAYTLQDAQTMVELARKHNTAVMCASLLRFSPYLDRTRKRLADVGPVGCLFVQGCGASLAAVFHVLSVVQNLLGEGCESVESMGENLFDVLRLHYPGRAGGTSAVILNRAGWAPGHKVTSANYHHTSFRASAYGPGGAVHTPRIDDYLFPEGGVRIVRMARRMARTRQPPIPYDSMLELMRMIEAARKAHNTGTRVYLDDFR